MAEERSFVSEPPEDYICSICSKVLTDPQLTDCCGQHFCLGCLQQWFKKHGTKQCPHCRSTQFTYIVYLPLKRKIDELNVYCVNKANGCQVVTSLSKSKAHREECKYAKVICEQGCGCVILHKDMQDHCKNTCQKRIISCSYCSKAGPYDEITDEKHRSVCPDYPVGCPKKCDTENSAQIKRKDLKTHENVCPLELVPCSLCNIQYLRRSIVFHSRWLCPKRQVKCQYCHLSGPHDEINGSHIARCGDYPIGCPRNCKGGEKLKQKELEQHATKCELEPVQCAFFDAGCRVPLLRKDLRKHMESRMQSHLQNCLQLQLQMANDYRKLKGNFDMLQADHKKLKDEHNQFLKTHDEMKSSVSTELNRLTTGDIQMTHMAVQCIKTILSPNLTKLNSLVFQSRQPPNEVTPFIWSSDPILIDNTYKVKLTIEIQNERWSAKSLPSHRRPASNHTATATLYFYYRSRDSNQSIFDLQKDIHVEITLSNFSSGLVFNDICPKCIEDTPPLKVSDRSIISYEMEVIAKRTTQIRGHDLSTMTVVLNLQDHVCSHYVETTYV